MRKLPTPVTTPDEYSYAIVAELRSLNAKLDAIMQATGVQQAEPQPRPEGSREETVELREPEPKHRDAKRREPPGRGRPRKRST